MMSRKNLLSRSRQHTSSKNLLRHSPYSRSIYQPDQSSKYSINITPERAPIDKGEYGATRPKQRLANNLNYKIDSIIKHNSYLLDENNKLTEIVREKEMKIQIVQEQLRQQLIEQQRGLVIIEKEKKRILFEVQKDLDIKDEEIQSLVLEVKCLKEEVEAREDMYKMENIRIKEDYSRQAQFKLQNIKRSQIYNIEIYEAQINKLKEVILSKQEELEQQEHYFSVKEKKLEEEVRMLNMEIRHELEKKGLEIEELKLRHETEFGEMIREKSNQRDIDNANYQNIIKRVKKELIEKTLESERLNFRLEQTATENQAEYGYIHQEKLKAEYEMEQLQLKNKESIIKEKNKVEELAHAEIMNLELCHANFINSLKSQKEKLVEINEMKGVEIERLNLEIERMREARRAESETDARMIRNLEGKVESMGVAHQQEVEMLKVKMALLHHGDVSGLMKSYEEQIKILSDEIVRVTGICAQNRQKLHQELSAKTEMRKQQEIQLSKHSNENTQLKLQLQSLRLQMREHIDDIRSKHEITSASALVERETNRKDLTKRELDIKKLEDLVNTKDIQIHDLNEMLASLKKSYEEELKVKREEGQRLRVISEGLDNELRKEKEFLAKELRKKEEEYRVRLGELEEELRNVRGSTYEQLMNELRVVEMEKNRLEGELAKERLSKEIVMKSENTQKQMMEVMRLESSAALEMQKDQSSKKSSLEETKWKRFYTDIIKSKDKEIEELKRRFFEKEGDNRDVENKAAGLEQRLQTLMDRQSSLREIEIKTLNLGMDQNLIKNTAELFRGQLR